MPLPAGLIAFLLVAQLSITDAGRSLSMNGQWVGGAISSSADVYSSTDVIITEFSTATSSSSFESSSQVAPWLLPDELRPEIAYLDAETGVYKYEDLFYDSDVLVAWNGVMETDLPSGALWFTGGCRLLQPVPLSDDDTDGVTTANAGPAAAVQFDGVSCHGKKNLLPSTTGGSFPSGAFTAIWIGYVDSPGSLSSETSRTPFAFETALYDINGGVVPPPPYKQWTMEVVSRQSATSSVASAVHEMSYYRYGPRSGELSVWRFDSALHDPFSGTLAVGVDVDEEQDLFSGKLSVVLLYNRALEESEVHDLATFYSSRFGWQLPL
ncbi:hypothetical protein VOLCADRAFT_100440 [Volvox carteri f. nagariensis]|uniref:Uncharacterized protein n=1 Tax=Volvox carteri f. nagariensis TaxID=3068 RepID=D8UK77_VOLCA|nr:uncharacterized protein VOLCADRAFT_100440 [Volvox carteri f. nagariensis]EFJ39857.1 hypothetical protein VOLCADRAFT_100440 [Volvox carteri f. nagariensis]|eukprot:XP_002959063.1 hypothetical protein VOLCADRAFT_100440 [Volvox carteri f. nagariensis]